MIKHIRKLPQRSMNQAKGSALKKYRDRVVGKAGAWGWIRYELAVTLFTSVGGALGLALRKVFFPGLFARCGKGVQFGRNLTLRQPGNIEIGAGTLIDDFAVLDAKSEQAPAIIVGERCLIARGAKLSSGYSGSVKIGNETIIGDNALVHGPGGIEIGSKVLVSDGATLNAGRHIYDDRERAILDQGITVCGIKVEDDVWIGTGAIILDGVALHHGCVVEAGSVVREDVPPYAVVRGNPAVVVGERGAAFVK